MRDERIRPAQVTRLRSAPNKIMCVGPYVRTYVQSIKNGTYHEVKVSTAACVRACALESRFNFLQYKYILFVYTLPTYYYSS
jgi:hypothetical protein